MTTLLSSRALAEVLGVRVRTITTWAAAGRIPRVRVGARTIRYELAEVLDALRANDPATQTPCPRAERQGVGQ